MIDHVTSQFLNGKRLFKELLTTFFSEFLDLFLPDIAGILDRDSIRFLPQEYFTYRACPELKGHRVVWRKDADLFRGATYSRKQSR